MSLVRSPVRTGAVVATTQLTPRMRRITVRCDDLPDGPIRPAQDVELLLREPSGRRVKRRYTIRHARREPAELDLDVLLHGDGAGSSWGTHAAPGDAIEFQGPRGKLELRNAAWHLLCGDESALPAIAAIAEALPDTERAVALIEVRDASDELPVSADVHWVHRGAHPPGTPDLLLPAASQLDLPFAQAHGYLMGETRSMVALRSLFEGCGLPHEAIFLKGYWNIGRPDRIAGRRPAPA
ncbi:MAG TPA: siderophore-interacting protein [Jatrophihabitantaceae bacterium]|nr:siderophore-interacting protein [Jatrophihabitantaceae bacterium]